MSKRERERKRRGAALVEMAIALPLLVLLTFAAIEYGWMWFRASQVNQAARHGSRVAVRPQATQDEVRSAVDAVMAQAGFKSGSYQIHVEDNDGVAITDVAVPVGESITVEVTVPYGPLRLGGFVPVPQVLYGSVTMAKEGP